MVYNSCSPWLDHRCVHDVGKIKSFNQALGNEMAKRMCHKRQLELAKMKGVMVISEETL